jgi:COMPASS component SWD3
VGADAQLLLWDPHTGKQLRALTGHARGISELAWSPGGNYIATASDDHTLKLWDVEAGKCLRTLAAHTNYVFCCSFSPHGHLLVRCGAHTPCWLRKQSDMMRSGIP